VARVEDLDSNTILACLISFHAAAVVVADNGCAGWRLLRDHKVLRSWRWGAIADSVPVSVGFQPEIRTTVGHSNSGSPKLKTAIGEPLIGYRDEARKTSTLQISCKQLIIRCLG
jgi:hypothetical protein